MRSMTLIPAAVLAAAAMLPAQEVWRPSAVEVRPFAGIFLPVGAQRADFKAATMFGGQAAMELSRYMHALGSIGFTHGHNKFYAKDLTHIWQYDLGLEVNLIREIGYKWDFRPFLGAGGGGRTYDYRSLTDGTRSCLAGYGTAGAELQRGVVAFRVEGRDYLSCFESPETGSKRTRNDLGLSVGVAYHLR